MLRSSPGRATARLPDLLDAAVCAGRDLGLLAPVQELVLAEHDRVRVLDGGPQQPVGVGGGGGADDLQAGVVVEPGLDVLGVVRPAADAAAVRAAHDHRHRPADAVVHLGGAGDQLVEGDRDEVAELHLGHRALPGHRRADRDPGDAGLGHGRVDRAHHPVLLLQPLRGAERAALAADVLAHAEDARIGLHLVVQGGVDRLEVRELGHGRLTEPPSRRRPRAPPTDRGSRRARPSRRPRAPPRGRGRARSRACPRPARAPR